MSTFIEDKGSANRMKKQIYLIFSEVQPTLTEGKGTIKKKINYQTKKIISNFAPDKTNHDYEKDFIHTMYGCTLLRSISRQRANNH